MELHEHYPNKDNARREILMNDMKEFSAKYDLVLVFPMVGENKQQQSDVAKHVMYEMLEAGLEIFTYLSVQDDELYCLIRAPLDILKRFADKIDYKMKADPPTLEKTLKAGDPAHRIKPVEINADYTITPYSPYENIYVKYDQDVDQSLYYEDPMEKTAFTKQIRIKLLYLLIRAPRRDHGCDVQLSRLLHKKRILAIFPIHDRGIADNMYETCMNMYTWPWQVPAEDVRSYFGEKVALFNVFLGHYSWWLIIPSFIGFVFQFVVWGTLNFSHPVLPFYSLVITVWSIFMLEYWKRTEATTALRWGMTDFEQLEQDRPEFRGEVIKSPINGHDFMYYPPSKKSRLVRNSASIIMSFILLVIGTVAAIYVFRFYLQGRSDTSSASSTIASILNTVQITIFNMIYQVVATKLTDYENHRTDTRYEDSLIIKLFVFQFINSYASFFFLAFIASNLARPDNAPINFLGQCGATNCMEPLSINLAIIFGTRLTLTNVLEILIPYITHQQKIKAETSGIDPNKELTPAEKDYFLIPYDIRTQSLQNYADTAVQYGFTLLFITALPIASFFSLLNSYVKVKFTAMKLLWFYQRPVPVGVQDIGTWQTIFTIISVAAVITNAGLICFTMNVLWEYTLQARVWIFLGFQWVLISIQFITQAIIPDVPAEVEMQVERMEYIQSKVIEHVEDEDFSDEDEDDDHDDDDEAEEQKKKWKCCSVQGKSGRGGRIHKGLPELTVAQYPFGADVQPTPLKANDPRLPKFDVHKKKKHNEQIDVEVSHDTGASQNKNDGTTYY